MPGYARLTPRRDPQAMAEEFLWVSRIVKKPSLKHCVGVTTSAVSGAAKELSSAWRPCWPLSIAATKNFYVEDRFPGLHYHGKSSAARSHRAHLRLLGRELAQHGLNCGHALPAPSAGSRAGPAGHPGLPSHATPLRTFSKGDAAPTFHNLDRLANRFFDYPRHLRDLRSNVDLFHIVDHSYSQLVHSLPAERTVVTCHDLDTFRCLLDPACEKRPGWFRAMTARILKGFTQAAHVITGSAIVRER